MKSYIYGHHAIPQFHPVIKSSLVFWRVFLESFLDRFTTYVRSLETKENETPSLIESFHHVSQIARDGFFGCSIRLCECVRGSLSSE